MAFDPTTPTLVALLYGWGFTRWRDAGYLAAAAVGVGLAARMPGPLSPWILALLWTVLWPPFLAAWRSRVFLTGGAVARLHSVAWLARTTCVSSDQRAAGFAWEAEAQAFSGRLTEAVQWAERAARVQPRAKTERTSTASTLAGVFVAAARYRDAVCVVESLEPIERYPRGSLAWSSRIVAELHAASAEALIGAGTERRDRLRTLENDERLHPAIRNALLLNDAHERARDGDGDLALRLCDAIDRGRGSWIPWNDPLLCYIRGRALSALGRHDEARASVQQGLERARLVKSRRDGKLLLGLVRFRAGALDDAVHWFRSATDEPYVRQGGEYLVHFGECLNRLGRFEEARAAYRMVDEWDPESTAARTAKECLASLPASGA